MNGLAFCHLAEGHFLLNVPGYSTLIGLTSAVFGLYYARTKPYQRRYFNARFIWKKLIYLKGIFATTQKPLQSTNSNGLSFDRSKLLLSNERQPNLEIANNKYQLQRINWLFFVF